MAVLNIGAQAAPAQRTWNGLTAMRRPEAVLEDRLPVPATCNYYFGNNPAQWNDAIASSGSASQLGSSLPGVGKWHQADVRLPGSRPWRVRESQRSNALDRPWFCPEPIPALCIYAPGINSIGLMSDQGAWMTPAVLGPAARPRIANAG